MNNLNRDIEVGEVVVLQKGLFKPKFHDRKQRLFRCNGGFGMSWRTSGTAISGVFVEDGERARYEGYHIDVEETEKYQSEQSKHSIQQGQE